MGEYLAAASGAVLILSLFGPWYEAGGADLTAWETFSVLDVLFLLLGALGVALLLVTAAQRTAAVGIAADSLLFLMAAPVALVALIRFLNLPGAAEELNAGRGLFSYVGTLAVLGVAGGALLAMRDERLSAPDRPTDVTGVPVEATPEIESLPAPPPPAPS